MVFKNKIRELIIFFGINIFRYICIIKLLVFKKKNFEEIIYNRNIIILNCELLNIF